MLYRFALPVAGLLFLAALSRAAVPAPPPPEVYSARIRFRIEGIRTARAAQFDEMMRFLTRHGFRRDPEDVTEDEVESPAFDTVRGTVPSKQAGDLIVERHVRAILLLPQGAMLPEDKAELVRLDLQLPGGMGLQTQRTLHDQVHEVLASIGFRAAIGYDHRNFTRVLGSIAASKIEGLLDDLRKLPAGARQGPPFASTWPLRVIEALPGAPLPGARPGLPKIPAEQAKLTADLREVLADAAAAKEPRRLEVVLAAPPAEDDRLWAGRLVGGAPGARVEGRLGPIVTVWAAPGHAPAIAAGPEVLAVRLARVARTQSLSASPNADAWRPLLDASGVMQLHDRQHRGKGSRAAILDSDFSGWQTLVGKQLPAGTRLIDLTAERNDNLLPDPLPSGGGLGSGTRRAVAFSRAAPEANLVLIRVDPASAYMVYQVARAINCDPYVSINMDNRLAELEARRRQLDDRREKLLEERKLILENFEQEGAAVKGREEYKKRQAEFDADEREQALRVQRFLQYQKDIQGLKGIRLVASALVWDDGFPTDGGSALSRYFDDRPFRGALWFQAAGDTRGQSWVGMFGDTDGNRVLEFAPPEQALPEGSWTPELNFLHWRGEGNKLEQDIPAKARVRVSLQWREAHEGLYRQIGEDLYRDPLARLNIVVLHQPDPTGKTRPADDLEVVALSAGVRPRLAQTLTGATYELTVDFVAAKAGRYAVRIEGVAPEGILPRGTPTIPAARKEGELHLRLFINTLSGPGRAVLRDFATGAGNVGMPADARTAVTTGAADSLGKPRPYSAGGPPFALDLLPKPEVIAFDEGGGTGEAAAFAAGLAAALQGAGVSRAGFLIDCFRYSGALLRIPGARPFPPSVPVPVPVPVPDSGTGTGTGRGTGQARSNPGP
jgi:hypothetical protein